MRWWEPWLLVVSGLGIAIAGASAQSAPAMFAGFAVLASSLLDAAWRLRNAGHLAVAMPRSPRIMVVVSLASLAVGVSVPGAFWFVRGAVADAPLNSLAIVLTLFAAPFVGGLLAASAYWSRRTTPLRQLFHFGALIVVVCAFTVLGTLSMILTAGFAGRAGMTAQSLVIEFSGLWFSAAASVALFGVAVATITAAVSRGSLRRKGGVA